MLLWATQPPATVQAGETWASFGIEIVDLYGNRTSDTDAVAIAPSSGTLDGTLSRAASGGLASFDDISCSAAHTITITGSAAGLAPTPASSQIVVEPGTLYHLVIEDAPGGGGHEVDAAEIFTDETLTVYAIGYDSDGNCKEEVSVTWSWASGDFDAGDLTTTTGSSTTFAPDHAGMGVLKADDGNGHVDITGSVTVRHRLAALSISKSALESHSEVGEDVVFSITVTNEGENEVLSFEVLDILPFGLTYLSDNSGGLYNVLTGTWYIDALAP